MLDLKIARISLKRESVSGW